MDGILLPHCHRIPTYQATDCRPTLDRLFARLPTQARGHEFPLYPFRDGQILNVVNFFLGFPLTIAKGDHSQK
jgi:hypothetical protein